MDLVNERINYYKDKQHKIDIIKYNAYMNYIQEMEQYEQTKKENTIDDIDYVQNRYDQYIKCIRDSCIYILYELDKDDNGSFIYKSSTLVLGLKVNDIKTVEGMIEFIESFD